LAGRIHYNSGTTVTGLLQNATNPENGTVIYTYNINNLLATKTDAKNQELTYAYDGYNRLTSVSVVPPYTCPPPPQSCNPPPAQVLRTYYYDTNPLDSTGFSKNIAGRLAAVQYPAQSTIQMNDMYSYTAAGQLGAGLPATKRLQVNQPVVYKNNNNQNVNQNIVLNLDDAYTYNGEGQMTAVTYPSTGTSITPVAGASYNYSYDSMYRLGGMKTSGGTTIVNNVSYNAASQLLTMTFGNTTETRGYNILNQLTSLNAQNVPSGTIENLNYNYSTGTNNGKIGSMYNAVSGETVTYTYDSLNRLLTANGSGWGQQYGFDSFGNLLSKTVTAGSGPSLLISVNPANNQIQGVYGLSYDANGNQNVGNYDAENRLISAGTTQYGYDAQNKRIWSWPGTTDSLNNTTSYTVNMYSPGGQKLGAYLFVPTTTTQNGLIVPMIQVTLSSSDQYFGGRRLAVMDQLGSAGTYFPWGETKGTSNPQDTWNFATYWQDSASGLDYANNRYYANAYGRFMTPDPYKSASASSPQSWNQYAYVTGDPVNLSDPNGTDPENPGPPSYCFDDPQGMFDPLCTCPNGICSLPTGSASGSGLPPNVPCYQNFNQISNTLFNVGDAVLNQVLDDPKLNLTSTQENNLTNLIISTVADEVSAMASYSGSGPDPAYYKGGHFNLVLSDSALQQALGSAGYADFQSALIQRFNAASLGQALHGNLGPFGTGQPSDTDYFHLDTANPSQGYGAGLLIHFGRDVVAGQVPQLFGKYPCLDQGF
jgi:RHS repeat-associated protein